MELPKKDIMELPKNLSYQKDVLIKQINSLQGSTDEARTIAKNLNFMKSSDKASKQAQEFQAYK